MCCYILITPILASECTPRVIPPIKSDTVYGDLSHFLKIKTSLFSHKHYYKDKKTARIV